MLRLKPATSIQSSHPPFANASSVNHKLALVNSFIDDLALIEGSFDDTASIASSSLSSYGVPELGSLKELSSESLTLLRQMLPADDSIKMKAFIDSSSRPSAQVLLSVLYKAVGFHATKCIQVLLNVVTSLSDPSDLNGRNLFHKIVISYSRPRPEPVASSNASTSTQSSNVDQQFNGSLYIAPAISPAPPIRNNTVPRAGQDGINSNSDDNNLTVLTFILDRLNPALRPCLIAKDAYKRTPVHYAAQAGLKALTKLLVDYAIKWDLVNTDSPFSGPDWQDSEGFVPLQLSIKGNHPLTSRVLLDVMLKSQVEKLPICFMWLPD